MNTNTVAIVRYQEPFQSVKEAVNKCNGLEKLPSNARVFIKPNIVFWTKACNFPKWGVITTSRVIEDIVVLLKEQGIQDITIGEGIVDEEQNSEVSDHAFKTLGYQELGNRYGVQCVDVNSRPFHKVDLGEGISLKFNEDLLNSDFVVNLPVLKTHNQTVVSLGIKNLIDTPSRKKCHSADPEKDLHFYISKIADKLPPIFTLIDGIYSLERGPAFDGRMKRSNLLVASSDILAADLVGSKLLGHQPEEVPHLKQAADNWGRSTDLSDVNIVGENLEEVAEFHEYDFPYVSDENGEMPRALAKQGITGLFYRKFDSTMCTYCSHLNGLVLTAIRNAWEGEPFNNVEVLTGKAIRPAPGMNATILLGQCMHRLNRNHPNIKQEIPVKGCPPDPQEVVSALHEAGIKADPTLFEQIDKLPGFFMSRYEGKPEFDESFFRVE